jgi:2-polyprenyl-3-methyl-5-hydroxy-6-metoxy-1,4-benzoquinol methylase
MIKKMDYSKRLKAKNSFDGSIVFQNKDFERITGRNKHRKNVDDADLYFSKFINLETQEFDNKYIQERACPTCDSKGNYKKIFVKNGAIHVKCCKCSMIFVNPVLKESYLLEFYKKNNSWLNVLENIYEREIDIKKYQYSLDIINSFQHKKERSVLDIGCASGLFLDVAKKNGWRPYGIEINKRAIENLNEKQIDYWNSLEEAINSKKCFDILSMWDFFEHLYNPGEMLKNMNKLLNKGGTLFMNIPNVLSLSSRILREKSGTFDGRGHINFFSESTITKLLNRFEFEVLEVETAITELKTISNYLNYDDPYAPSQNHPYFPLLTPEIIHKNKWGSRLLVYAKKE